MQTTARYRARKIGWTTAELDYPRDPEADSHPPYGIWDTLEHRWVDKYGQPDPDGDYYACGLAVASMRARDLNQYAKEAMDRMRDSL
jgi:hypothetical protein